MILKTDIFSEYAFKMDVSNLLGHFLVNPASFCVRPNLEVSQVYLPALVPLSNGSNSTVTLVLPPQQHKEEVKSDTEDNSDECEDEESSNDVDYTSEEESGTKGNETENHKSEKRKKKQKCIHRTRYSREEYRCESCPYICTTEKAFLRHVRQCDVKDPNLQSSLLSCPVCGKDRRNELSLSTHMVKHKSGKYFCCDLCKFKSIQLKKIIQHRRMHTGEKPHLCPHCSYRSSRRDNLRSHVRRMHNEDDLHCDTFTPRKILLLPNSSNKVS